MGDGLGVEQQWLSDTWAKVAPLFGKSASATPLPSLFKHIRFSNQSPFVGVATDPGKGADSAELLWPRWLWQSSKGQKKLDERTKLQLFIHEMAHRFQSADQTKAVWLSEGGAEAFARIMMGRRFGGAVRNGADPYNEFVTRVMKEKGWGWVTSGQFANAAAGAGQSGHGQPRLSGVNLAIDAARRAGFKGTDLVNMIAIAGRESGYNPRAQNLKPPDHSIGLWQINQLAHHGRFGSDAELMNPYVNARAAYTLSGGGRTLSPWAHAGGPLGGTNVAAARAAVKAFSGTTSTGGAGNSAGSGAAGSGAASVAAKVNPLDQKFANADLAIEQAKRGAITIGRGAGARKISSAMQQVAALGAKRRLVGARIRSIRKALKGKLSPTKRLALTQELTQRLQEHAQLGTDIQGLRTPAAAGGDGGSIADVGGAGDTGDPNQALIDSNNTLQAAIEAQVQADKEHTDAINALQAAISAQNAIATSTLGIGLREAQRALADVIGNQLGGYMGATGRALTAGSGSIARY